MPLMPDTRSVCFCSVAGKLLAFTFWVWVLGLGGGAWRREGGVGGADIIAKTRYLCKNIYGKLHNSVVKAGG